ncbi:MAG: two-component system, OmpR family, phosphate regulon response regulator PhoB [Chloroflexota bacterium]|jgi:DNA-binding response OmpR family regulator|nr:two-component system, OmpR family, phosphate regulon response regulator PhoB [Chloroflexota bacterium]
MTAEPDEPALLVAVEDEPRNAALLEAILGRSGYRLLIAPDLAGARKLLAEMTPDLVLLDRHLPDGDGLDLIPEIRNSGRLGAVPILLVSASVLPRDVQAAMDAGCDGFLPKPVHVKPLVEAVRRLLDRNAAVDA